MIVIQHKYFLRISTTYIYIFLSFFNKLSFSDPPSSSTHMINFFDRTITRQCSFHCILPTCCINTYAHPLYTILLAITTLMTSNRQEQCIKFEMRLVRIQQNARLSIVYLPHQQLCLSQSSTPPSTSILLDTESLDVE